MRGISKFAAAVVFAIISAAALTATAGKPAHDPGLGVTGAVPRDQALLKTAPDASGQRPSDERITSAIGKTLDQAARVARTEAILQSSDVVRRWDPPSPLHQRPPPV
ncbi:MAG TPA: hypothetical protein VGV35_00940 [Bryobacteraceae bacterium]|nr:hypothetical protein [Bryobacteraceae bacterium]